MPGGEKEREREREMTGWGRSTERGMGSAHPPSPRAKQSTERERRFYRPSGGTAGLVSASTILQMLKEVAARVSSCSTHR